MFSAQMNAICKLATDNLQEVCKTRKTCETRENEKKGRKRNNVKINYTRLVIQLFSHTIKFYPLLHDKIPCETREIYLKLATDDSRDIHKI